MQYSCLKGLDAQKTLLCLWVFGLFYFLRKKKKRKEKEGSFCGFQIENQWGPKKCILRALVYNCYLRVAELSRAIKTATTMLGIIIFTMFFIIVDILIMIRVLSFSQYIILIIVNKKWINFCPIFEFTEWDIRTRCKIFRTCVSHSTFVLHSMNPKRSKLVKIHYRKKT